MPEPTPNPLASLTAAAEAVRRQLQAPAYDADAVQRLAEFIEQQRPSLTAATREGVVTALGCFLGQCLVETFGGTWAMGPDGTTGIGIRQHSFFNPFYRISQQLDKGLPESVAAFFAGIPERLASAPRRKNWIS
ncbi:MULTISPECIES: hypothetical protein [Hymenobacter]|jgi:hypothetical protein|uniref:DUF3806 domain-containing protein n=1 Tax=Hymenobacter yonginensis TaxID=748197 RepID=A0ABY7PNH4_9BACT|nr:MULTISPECIES: hypothetical protein [Hymenobacter]AII51294.1 hypothetical protein N008_04765 [Hymenobacter sp. APR13]WBO84801.1 hypothetical protein O9Z63_00840 [Hymenobacter yonginensis]